VPIPNTLPELTLIFERLGAPDPASWARSQINEGFSQLHRFLFLRQAWSHIIPDEAAGWIKNHIEEAEKNPVAPFAGMGSALKRATAAGVTSEDLTQIARGVQAELLWQLCYMLDDNGIREADLKEIGWGLFETDEEGKPGAPIYSLHESVLGTDPTGREMRPKQA